MAATSPHSTWPVTRGRSALPSAPESTRGSAATSWRDRLADPINRLYRYALARLLVRGLVKTRVTPNQVTLLQPLMAAVAGYLVTFGDARHVVLAALLFEARALLGCVDETLARATNAAANGRAERAAARGLSAAFLYAGIAWHFHLHAPPALLSGAYVSTSAVGVVWIATAIGLGSWLFARSPNLAVA